MNRKKKSGTKPLYRIGCTSYCFPDDILPNVKKVAPLVDDVEILLFESDNSLEFKNLEIIDDLKQLTQNHNITYTIHLPIDTPVLFGCNADNTRYLNQITEIIAKTKDLFPFAYILHLDGIGPNASRGELHDWRKSCVKLCSDISRIHNLDLEKICLENMEYPLEWFLDFQEMFGFSLCLDIGHLWMHEGNWEDVLIKCLPATRVIHLHGVKNGKDHLSLKESDFKNLFRLVSFIKKQFIGVVTLEIFSLNDMLESYDILKRIQRQ